MEFERRTVAWVGVEDAFDFFADPANLPLYVPTVAFEEAVAVDGDPGAGPDPELGTAGPEARFLPDRAAHRVEWSLPGGTYAGSVEVSQGSPNSTDVRLRYRTGADADPERVREMIEQVVRTIGRRLSGR